MTMTSISIRQPVTGVCLALCLGASLHLTAAPDTGWQSLFNGKDLSGWTVVHDAEFTVVDSNLRLVTGMGWLRTEKEYGDFILEFECRALEERYDSGFFFRVGIEGKPWPKDGWQVNLRHDAIGGLVRGYTGMEPAPTARIPVNRWMKFRLEVRGSKAILTVDGEEGWETDKIDRARGYLGIQAEDRSFDFRNLRIQEL
jgi:hypothetical protein